MKPNPKKPSPPPRAPQKSDLIKLKKARALIQVLKRELADAQFRIRTLERYSDVATKLAGTGFDATNIAGALGRADFSVP